MAARRYAVAGLGVIPSGSVGPFLTLSGSSGKIRDLDIVKINAIPFTGRTGSMGKSGYLGEFEQVVMLALARVGEDAYSVPVHEEILRTTGRDVAIASVYVTLSRLQDKGLLASEREPRAEATGRPRRFYRMTAAGWEALRASRAMIDAMWDGVEVPETRS